MDERWGCAMTFLSECTPTFGGLELFKPHCSYRKLCILTLWVWIIPAVEHRHKCEVKSQKSKVLFLIYSCKFSNHISLIRSKICRAGTCKHGIIFVFVCQDIVNLLVSSSQPFLSSIPIKNNGPSLSPSLSPRRSRSPRPSLNFESMLYSLVAPPFRATVSYFRDRRWHLALF